jgi:methylmalonyl-CoA mutase
MSSHFSDFAPHSQAQWKEAAESSLKGRPLHTLNKELAGGIPLQAMYHASFDDHPEHCRTLEAPQTQKAWRAAQENSATKAAQWNAFMLEDAKRSVKLFHMRLDSATRRGFLEGETETWRPGLRLESKEDLAEALKGFPAGAELQVECGFAFLHFMKLWKSFAEQEKALAESIEITLLVDATEEAALRGSMSFMSTSKKQAFSAFFADFASTLKMKKTRIKIASTLWAEHSLDSARELAILLASARWIFTGLLDAGLALEDILQNVQLECGLSHRVLLQIAKQRALRLVWASYTEAYDAPEKHRRAHLMTRGLRRYQSERDPWTNLLRASLQGFAAALGEADSIHMSTLADGVGTPQSFERRLASNNHLILKDEGLLEKVQDPVRGSWYLESLTHTLASMAWQHFQTLESLGGLFKADGTFQDLIHTWVDEAGTKENSSLLQRKTVIVGSNRYTAAESLELETQPPREEALTHCPQPSWSFSELRVQGFQPTRLAQPLESVAKVNQLEGKRLWLACMGALTEHQGRRDFCSSLFHSVGIQAEHDAGESDMQKAAQAAFDAKGPACVICGRDDRYEGQVKAFIQALRQLESQADRPAMKVYLAGRPKPLVEGFKQAGVAGFIHVSSDILALQKAIFTQGVQV